MWPFWPKQCGRFDQSSVAILVVIPLSVAVLVVAVLECGRFDWFPMKQAPVDLVRLKYDYLRAGVLLNRTTVDFAAINWSMKINMKIAVVKFSQNDMHQNSQVAWKTTAIILMVQQ